MPRSTLLTKSLTQGVSVPRGMGPRLESTLFHTHLVRWSCNGPREGVAGPVCKAGLVSHASVCPTPSVRPDVEWACWLAPSGCGDNGAIATLEKEVVNKQLFFVLTVRDDFMGGIGISARCDDKSLADAGCACINAASCSRADGSKIRNQIAGP